MTLRLPRSIARTSTIICEPTSPVIPVLTEGNGTLHGDCLVLAGLAP